MVANGVDSDELQRSGGDGGNGGCDGVYCDGFGVLIYSGDSGEVQEVLFCR